MLVINMMVLLFKSIRMLINRDEVRPKACYICISSNPMPFYTYRGLAPREQAEGLWDIYEWGWGYGVFIPHGNGQFLSQWLMSH